MQKVKLFIFIAILWIVIVTAIFNKYAYQIFEFNSTIRVFVKEGKMTQREFDVNGLPTSYSARIGKYLSPFYVVHYAIIYSDKIQYDSKINKYIWREDPSLKYWNIHPDSNKTNNENLVYFKNSVDWLVENVDVSRYGQYHYLYDFEWRYLGFNNNKLDKYWWSGLTDAYAIIPLLRAYEIYGEPKYLHTAIKLYQSVLTEYERYGSLTSLDGFPWIEEYMDKHIVEQTKLPYVFNGMVYATFGIQALESMDIPEVNAVKKDMAPKLIESIAYNTYKFNHNGWSHYDLYHKSNNIKYHLIHQSLLRYLLDNDFADLSIDLSELYQIQSEWKYTSENVGLYYVLLGEKSVAYYHFILLYIILLFFPLRLFYSMGRKK